MCVENRRNCECGQEYSLARAKLDPRRRRPPLGQPRWYAPGSGFPGYRRRGTSVLAAYSQSFRYLTMWKSFSTSLLQRGSQNQNIDGYVRSRRRGVKDDGLAEGKRASQARTGNDLGFGDLPGISPEVVGDAPTVVAGGKHQELYRVGR